MVVNARSENETLEKAFEEGGDEPEAWNGKLEGAIHSGQRAAKDVIASLM